MEYQYFEEQLKKTLATVYKEPKVAKALTLIPLTHEMPEGIRTMEIPVVTEVGMAKVVADRTTEIPDVSQYVTFIHAKAKLIANKFSFGVQEVVAARTQGQDLSARGAIIARKVIEQKMEQIAWLGDAASNLQGLSNFPSLPEVVLPNGATGGSKSWDTKTPDEIIKDISSVYLAIRENSKGLGTPTTMVIPPRAWNKLVVTRVSNMTEETLMNFVRKSYPSLTIIEDVPELQTAGAAGTTRGLMYVSSPDTLRYEIPQPFKMLGPQEKGLLVEVPCVAETFGVIVTLPYNIAFFDGI
jgi:hypothetical protein